MAILSITPGKITKLPAYEGAPERVHEFDERSIAAVNLALTAKRPLLVRGDPGVGKTQLAEASASELQRAFYPFTVDARTASQDLLWRFDAVMRLAQAQLCSVQNKTAEEVEKDLAITNFVEPGPLWWAFDTERARRASSSGRTPFNQYNNETRQANGWVLLIDEIDKAESDVPNGLLEALGSVQFTPFGYEDQEPVRVRGIAPLIIITTNEERALPDAFVRRCLVLHLELPSRDNDLIDYLVQRGHVHFGAQTNEDVLREAACQLVKDRKDIAEQQLRPLPGQAEYLDLIRGVIGLAPDKFETQLNLLRAAARFTYKKHPELSQRLEEGPQ